MPSISQDCHLLTQQVVHVNRSVASLSQVITHDRRWIERIRVVLMEVHGPRNFSNSF